ncbi:MAG: UbiA family prenyltransferase [Bacteroidota bacterium]
MKSLFFFIKQILLLSRFKLSLSVAFSTLVAYLLASGSMGLPPAFLFLGIFLLASGASALNQIQERKFDAKMLRTHLRPVPNGALSLNTSLAIALALLSAGLILLWVFGTLVSLIMGVLSLLWYNLLYTYLKRITAFAMIPGTLTGVIPIIIGWEAAGGSLTDLTFLFICLFMVVWQLPHFILLMLRYKEDYRRAGFPALTDKYSIRSVKDIITSGVVAMLTVVAGMMYFGVFHLMAIQILTGIMCLAFVLIFMKDLYKKQGEMKVAFISINVFMLGVMILLLIDKLYGV